MDIYNIRITTHQHSDSVQVSQVILTLDIYIIAIAHQNSESLQVSPVSRTLSLYYRNNSTPTQ
jgi:hypothetical protein